MKIAYSFLSVIEAHAENNFQSLLDSIYFLITSFNFASFSIQTSKPKADENTINAKLIKRKYQ